MTSLIGHGIERTVSSTGKDACAVHNILQYCLEVQGLANVEAGFAKPGQPVPQVRYLQFKLSSTFHSSNLSAASAACGRTSIGIVPSTRQIIAVPQVHYTDLQMKI